MLPEINCLACKHSLYQTGEIQETPDAAYVICRYCATVYVVNYAVDCNGEEVVYIQPVKLSQKGFDSSFTEKSQTEEFEDLKEKIQNAKSVNEFLKSL